MTRIPLLWNLSSFFFSVSGRKRERRRFGGRGWDLNCTNDFPQPLLEILPPLKRESITQIVKLAGRSGPWFLYSCLAINLKWEKLWKNCGSLVKWRRRRRVITATVSLKSSHVITALCRKKGFLSLFILTVDLRSTVLITTSYQRLAKAPFLPQSVVIEVFHLWRNSESQTQQQRNDTCSDFRCQQRISTWFSRLSTLECRHAWRTRFFPCVVWLVFWVCVTKLCHQVITICISTLSGVILRMDVYTIKCLDRLQRFREKYRQIGASVSAEKYRVSQLLLLLTITYSTFVKTLAFRSTLE